MTQSLQFDKSGQLSQHLKKHNTNTLVEEEKEEQKETVNMCCSLCNVLQPKKCWRNSLLEYLNSKQHVVLCLGEQESLDTYTKLTGSKISQTWRDQLIKFINDQSGDYSDKRWEFDYFQKFNDVGYGEEEQKQELRKDEKSLKQAERLAMQSKGPDLIFQRSDSMKHRDQEETGQNALRISSNFHDRVLLIKKHLEQKKHPIAQILFYFKKIYGSQYYFLLMKNQKVYLKQLTDKQVKEDQDLKRYKNMDEKKLIANNVKVLRMELKNFIKCIVRQILKFYSIPLRANDIKKDLLENMVINIVLKDEIYTIFERLYSDLHYDSIQRLIRLQNDQELLDAKVNFEVLKVNKEFRMDPDVRALFNYTGDGVFEELQHTEKPFERTINNLQKISSIESPMCKLEHIYKCCTTDIQKSLDQFWRDFDIPSKKLSVDVDNLQSLIVYFISRMDRCPQIISNLYLIEDFLPEAVQISNRAFYLAMLQSSCEFLINIQKKHENDNKWKEDKLMNKSIANLEKIKESQRKMKEESIVVNVPDYLEDNLSLHTIQSIKFSIKEEIISQAKSRQRSPVVSPREFDSSPKLQSSERRRRADQHYSFTDGGFSSLDPENEFFERNRALKDDLIRNQSSEIEEFQVVSREHQFQPQNSYQSTRNNTMSNPAKSRRITQVPILSRGEMKKIYAKGISHVQN